MFSNHSLWWFIVHILRVVLFLDKQQRVSRREYVRGMVMVWTWFLFMLTLWLWICHGILQWLVIPLEDRLFAYLHIITDMWIWLVFFLAGICTLPLMINLIVKRLHDMNISGWRLCLPFPLLMIRLWVWRYILPWTSGINNYGDPSNNHVSSISWGWILFFICIIVILWWWLFSGASFFFFHSIYDMWHIDAGYYVLRQQEEKWCQTQYHISHDYMLYGESVLTEESDINAYLDCIDNGILDSKDLNNHWTPLNDIPQMINGHLPTVQDIQENPKRPE